MTAAALAARSWNTLSLDGEETEESASKPPRFADDSHFASRAAEERANAASRRSARGPALRKQRFVAEPRRSREIQYPEAIFYPGPRCNAAAIIRLA